MRFTRRQTVASLAASAAVPALAGCTRSIAAAPLPPPPVATAPPQEELALQLLDQTAQHLLQLGPEGATSLALDKDALAPLRFKLSDRSKKGEEDTAAVLRADLAKFDALDENALSDSTRTSVEVVKSVYNTALEGFALPYGDITVGGWRNTPYVVIQNVGAYLDVPRFLDSEHPVKSVSDAEAYLARLDSYPAQLDGELERMKSAAAYGLIPPDFLIDKTIQQMKGSIAGAHDPQGALVTSLATRAAKEGIAGDWGARAAKIAQDKVAPALERQMAELQRQRSRASDAPGLWARPDGDAFYRWALKADTTTTMTPDEIHQMGLDQLAELHGQMDPILRRIGYSTGSVGERMIALSKDPRYKFAEGDPGRAEIMAYIDKYIARWRGLTPKAFNTLVPGNLVVKRLPPEEEPGAPGAYGGAGSPDGSIPGKFWINLRTTDLHSKYSLPDLAAHEAIPGHVWQGEYEFKLPLVRSLVSFSAFQEGWALYAEQLVAELGGYDDFEVGKLGYLQSLAFRACRLVVDTGLHSKRWSRKQGVAFFVEKNGSNPQEVASEVDRYCSWAGQACAYKIGHSAILRERAKAQAALGAAYDLKAFNDVVVLGGGVPMDVLAKNVDRYIAKAKAGVPA